MQGHQLFSLVPEVTRQGFVGTDSVGIKRLALIARGGLMGIEKRNVWRRATEALIRVPAAALGETARAIRHLADAADRADPVMESSSAAGWRYE